jgi:hypothetical protein
MQQCLRLWSDGVQRSGVVESPWAYTQQGFMSWPRERMPCWAGSWSGYNNEYWPCMPRRANSQLSPTSGTGGLLGGILSGGPNLRSVGYEAAELALDSVALHSINQGSPGVVQVAVQHHAQARDSDARRLAV